MTMIYVYEEGKADVICIIMGENDDTIMEMFEAEYGSNKYSATHSPAIGFTGGLVVTSTTRYLVATPSEGHAFCESQSLLNEVCVSIHTRHSL